MTVTVSDFGVVVVRFRFGFGFLHSAGSPNKATRHLHYTAHHCHGFTKA